MAGFLLPRVLLAARVLALDGIWVENPPHGFLEPASLL
jgi:hypothetical protein